MPHLSPTQYDLVYNMTSFGLASMAASTVFFFLRISSFAEKYRAALCFTGLVTFIAMYHYFRIFNSFEKAYTPCKVTNGVVNYNDCNADTYGYNPTGHAFNDAYRCKYPRLDIRSHTYPSCVPSCMRPFASRVKLVNTNGRSSTFSPEAGPSHTPHMPS